MPCWRTRPSPTPARRSSSGNVGLSPGTSITGFDAVPGDRDHHRRTIADADERCRGHAAQGRRHERVHQRRRVDRSLQRPRLTSANLAPSTGRRVRRSSHGALSSPDRWCSTEPVTRTRSSSSRPTRRSPPRRAAPCQLINGAQECNVFWQVGSSATLGTGSVFGGNILALASVTVTTRRDGARPGVREQRGRHARHRCVRPADVRARARRPRRQAVAAEQPRRRRRRYCYDRSRRRHGDDRARRRHTDASRHSSGGPGVPPSPARRVPVASRCPARGSRGYLRCSPV